MANDLRHNTIHRAVHRPDLLAGCERELVLITGLITLTLIVVARSWVAAIIGVIFWAVVVGGLRVMAKSDPSMSKIYLQHIKYARYYPAHATPFAPGSTHSRER